MKIHIFYKCDQCTVSDHLVTAICRFSHRETNFLVPIFLSEHSSNPPHPQVTSVWHFLTAWDGSDQLMRAREWPTSGIETYNNCDVAGQRSLFHKYVFLQVISAVSVPAVSDHPCICDLSILTPWNTFSSPHFPVRTFFEPSTSRSHLGVIFLDGPGWVRSANASVRAQSNKYLEAYIYCDLNDGPQSMKIQISIH